MRRIEPSSRGTDLSTFTTPSALGAQSVRVIQIDSEPWFVAADLCRALGMDTTSGTNRHLRGIPGPDKGRTLCPTPGGDQRLSVVTEAGLYRLILRSDRPEARQFQDWVTREVLPSIRKVSVYHVGQEKVATGEKSLEQFVQEMLSNNNRLIEMLKAKIEEQGKDCGSGIDVAISA